MKTTLEHRLLWCDRRDKHVIDVSVSIQLGVVHLNAQD